MKKFILQTVTIGVISLLLIFSFDLSLDKLLSDKRYFLLPPDRPNIILGHSQPACSFNDSLIPGFLNLSSPMEGYFYTYYKTKKIIESNRHIKTVFIEFSNNQISGWANNRIWGEYMPALLPKYSSVIDFRGMLLLFSKSPVKVVKALSVSLQNKLWFTAGGGTNFIKEENWGGFFPTHHFYTDSQINHLLQQEEGDKSRDGIAQANLGYLEKTVQLCKDNNINVFLIRSPFPSYVKVENEEVMQKLLVTNFKGLEFLDFKSYPLTNEYFADLEHVNSKGARKFSLFFSRLVRDGLFTCENKQQFIDIKMELEER